MTETTASSLMQTNSNTDTLYDYEIGIIGCGGIGSHLVGLVVPALHRGGLLESTERITIRIYDSDVVSEENLAHQRFTPDDVGKHKVTAIVESMAPFTSERLRLVACPRDVRDSSHIEPADLLVVAVDAATARRVVHSSGTPFLDLRCKGDGSIWLDWSVDPVFITEKTPDQPAASCQHEGAIESGNIEFGFAWAAAVGATWVLSILRWLLGDEKIITPIPRASGITYGDYGELPLVEANLDPQNCIEPKLHSSNLVDPCISTGDFESEIILGHIAGLAKDVRWQDLWNIADRIGCEVSVLIDADDKIYVDIGTSGEVTAAPPVGAKVPFKLWIHTHPMDAYWSRTDRDTLACFTGLLHKAVVLGHDHYKQTVFSQSTDSALEDDGPLSSWTSEQTLKYSKRGGPNS